MLHLRELQRRQYPALTANELKQGAYLKLNFSSQDTASLLNIEASSVKISHYRSKKKPGLPEATALWKYIVSQ